ncbi:hypothetical protein PANDA_020394, partial [Ailuropoda melanoleuca]
MTPGNGSFVTEFILMGLTDLPFLQLPLFCLFLVMYVVTVLGNLGLITLIGLNSHLHTPMYFFLFNLSFIDLCYSSVFTPKMLTHTGCMLRLTFCDANTINHYLCDILPVLQLSCTSTYVNELLVLIVVGINVIVPSVTIFVSYCFILSSILRISSTEGRSKAFSTCSSHIVAVSIAFMYLKPSSAGSMDEGKISSVFYTNVVPLMNPFIYSLRN